MRKYHATKNRRRLLSLFLALAMILSVLGTSGYSVFALDLEGTESVETEAPQDDKGETIEVAEPVESDEDNVSEAAESEIAAPPDEESEPEADAEEPSESEKDAELPEAAEGAAREGVCCNSQSHASNAREAVASRDMEASSLQYDEGR